MCPPDNSSDRGPAHAVARPCRNLRGRPLLWPILLIASVVLPGAGSDAATDPRAAELTQLRENIAQLQSRIERTRTERDEMQERLRDTERRIGDMARRLHATGEKLTRNRREMEQLTVTEGRESSALKGQRRTLEAQIRTAYAMGKQQYLKMLLNQEDPASLGRVTTYYRYLNEARRQRIDAIKETLARLGELRAQIRQRGAELETLKTNLLDLKADLEDSRKDRADVVAGLNRQVQSQSEEIDRLKRDEEYLVRLIQGLSLYLDELREDKKVEMDFDRFRGRLQLPAQATLVARFGDPKQGELKWDGLFLGAGEGQNVHAVFRGRVAFADWFGSLGLLLIIDHGDGYMSLYGHNQSLFTEVGDWVETGQLVSAAGNSGGLDHPGLYFEIRHNGVPRNPLLWVRPS